MKERIKKEVVGKSVAIHITTVSQLQNLMSVARSLKLQPLTFNYDEHIKKGNFCVILKESCCQWCEKEWYVCHGYKIIEFSDLCKNDTIVIYRKDNEVIALDKSTGKKAVAKCNPADKFDFNTGAKLAFERLTRNVTFRVLCVEDISYFGELALRGDVFEFVDGVTTWRTGEESLYYKSFESFMCDNPSWRKSFVELKEGDDPAEILKKYGKTIKVGDTVKVIDTGRVYTTNIQYFKDNNLPSDLMVRYAYGDDLGYHYGVRVIEKDKFVVKFIANNVAVIKSFNTCKCHLIRLEGLEKC